MGVLPRGRIEKVQFYETHRAPWEANAVAIGLTAAQVTALTALVDTARSNYDKMLSVRADALAATEAFNNSVTLMQNAGAAAIKAIKTKAAMTNNPNVYTLAQIPAPLPPGPAPTPGTPSDLAIGLLGNGALELRWKCSNPTGAGGVIYEVQRRLSGSGGSFAYIGSTGTRKFVDETLPAGTAVATYQITAIRSTARGAPAQFLVNFGIGGDDGLLVQMLAAAGISNGGVFESQRGGGASDGMETGLTTSTVNGRAVRKTLPGSNGNGSAKRSHARH